MEWFKNIKTVDELNEKRRKLSKEFHPDVNPGTDENIMADINMQYSVILKKLMYPPEKNPDPVKKETATAKKESAPAKKARRIPKIELSEKEAESLIKNLTELTNIVFKIGANKLFSINAKK